MDLDKVVIEQAVRGSVWFVGASETAIDRLCCTAKMRKLESKQRLHGIGETTNHLYGLVSGRIRISIASSRGQEFTIVDLESNSWFGEAVFVGEAPRVLEAIAVQDSVIVQWPRQTILSIADDEPRIYKNILFEHIRNSRKVYELLGGMLFYPLKSRLAGRILELLKEHGRARALGVLLDVSLSQNDFARLSLGSRQRINKIFRGWAEREIIVLQGDRYLVTDIDALKAEVELAAD